MVQSRTDSSGAFVIALAAGPFVLPVLGVHVGDLLFAIPLITTIWGAVAAFAASRRCHDRRTAWLWFSAACAIAAAASVLGVVGSITGKGATAGLYVGLAASVALATAAAGMARNALRARGLPAMVDALLLAGVGASLVIYLLVLPGLERGDAVLTTVVVTARAGLVLIAAAAVGKAPAATRGGLVAAVALACLGDGVAAGSAAGLPFLSDAFTPLL